MVKIFRARLRSLFLFALSIGLIFYASTAVDIRSALGQIRLFGIGPALLALCALAVGIAFSSIRYWQVLRALGLAVPFRQAVHANLVGQIGGLLFFQIVGQTLARSAVLSRHGIQGPAVLIANVVERATALASLSLLAVLGATYLFGGNFLTALGGQLALLKFITYLVLALGAVGFLVLPRLSKLLLFSTLNGFGSINALLLLLSTILLHTSTLAAFVILILQIAPETPMLAALSAAAIVMFTASLPISFAGWGVRELSAIYVFANLGVAAEKALAVSVFVGLGSLGALFVASLTSVGLQIQNHAPRPSEGWIESAPASHDLSRMLVLVIPLACAVLVFFQVHVPVGDHFVNVNLADPLAVCGGLVFLFLTARVLLSSFSWRIPNLGIFILLGTALFTLAFLNGIWNIGFHERAFLGRFIGWFVLVAYFFTGALIAAQTVRFGANALFRVIAACGVVIAVSELLLIALINTEVLPRALMPLGNATGMAQNANAFALQLSVVLSLVIAGFAGRRDQGRAIYFVRIAATAIVLAALWFTKSRTGYIAALAMILTALLVGRWDFRDAFASAVAAFVLVAAIGAAHYISATLLSRPVQSSGQTSLAPRVQTSLAPRVQTSLAPKLQASSSDAERLLSIKEGLRIWGQYPIFGAGLGTSGELVKSAMGQPLVVHNTAVWMLAEFGLVGLLAFAAFGIFAIRSIYMGAEPGDRMVSVLLFTTVSFLLFSLPHDVFYQRLYWLVFGAALFTGRLTRTATPLVAVKTHPPKGIEA